MSEALRNFTPYSHWIMEPCRWYTLTNGYCIAAENPSCSGPERKGYLTTVVSETNRGECRMIITVLKGTYGTLTVPIRSRF